MQDIVKIQGQDLIISDDELEDAIYRHVNDYIDSLTDKKDIYNPFTFTGLIKYINRKMKFNKSIYPDINILNSIWDIYTELVYKYSQKPTIEEYALLIGISRETLYTWMRGEYRSEDFCEKLSLKRSDTVKKWQEECKLGRYKSAATGNVGGIFLCKAVDGMVETAPIGIVNESQKRSISVSEIRKKLNESKTQLLTDNSVKVIDNSDTI